MGLPAPIIRLYEAGVEPREFAEAAHGLGDSERVKDTELSIPRHGRARPA